VPRRRRAVALGSLPPARGRRRRGEGVSEGGGCGLRRGAVLPHVRWDGAAGGAVRRSSTSMRRAASAAAGRGRLQKPSGADWRAPPVSPDFETSFFNEQYLDQT
jgi:hypothetical protein